MSEELSEPLPEHFRYNPSGSSRWLYCHGSARTDLPNESSDAAELGTLAHAVAAADLLGKTLEASVEAEFHALEPELFDEICDSVRTYVEFVRGLEGEKHHEIKVPHPFIPEHGGTIDTAVVNGRSLHVVDFKNGKMFVRAKHNTQVKCYLCLARIAFPECDEFYGTVVQPRVANGYIETVKYTKQELDAFECEVMEATYDDEIVAGDHCSYCPLLATCEVAHKHAQDMAREDFEDLTKPSVNVPRLIEIMEYAPIVTELAKLCRGKLLEVIRCGGTVPGYKAGQSIANRTWKDETAVIGVMQERGYGPDKYMKQELKSPAQLEKLVASQVLEPLYHRPARGVSLVPAESKLQEVDFNSFEAITGDE